MSDASRDLILARVRAARGSAAPDPESVRTAYQRLPREYLTAHHDPASHDIVALFVERAADYRAVVERVDSDTLPDAVPRVLRARVAGCDGPIIVPEGLPDSWIAACRDGDPPLCREDDTPLSVETLDAASGVITGCAVAIAETGTVILDHGPGQGRRALTLVPDFHLVVVSAGQIAADLSDAFGRLDPARPHTLMSGPSATSDIEFTRVEGVHGPRTLHVLVVAQD